jgi:hypothetical protein
MGKERKMGRRLIQRACLALLAGGLVACSIPYGGTPTPRNPSAMTYPLPFDGSYQGHVYALGARDGTCPHRSYGVAEVGDSVLTLAYKPDVVFAAPIDPQGRIQQQVGQVSLQGKIERDYLDVTVADGPCFTWYLLHYVWNHSARS